MKLNNPFEYDAATNISPELVVKMFVENHNYTRFINSNRNAYLMGERGSGKSMTLLFNSYKYQELKSEGSNYPDNNFIGVYIPCKTPLTQKDEYLLQPNEFLASAISEHLMLLGVLHSIADTMQQYTVNKNNIDVNSARNDIEFILEGDLPKNENIFESIKLYANKELGKIQRRIMNQDGDGDPDLFSFATLILPVLEIFNRCVGNEDIHYMLMFDDVHDLNSYQLKSLNSWISYRDHALFSIKAAAAKLSKLDFITNNGGSILEGHDFILIDMEKPFQNTSSPFGNLAKEIIQTRLKLFGIDATPDDFFPISNKLKQDLVLSQKKARKEAEDKYSKESTKSINDYVYKYSRAIYFRERSVRANRPPYSGFEILVSSSTGVIRNLLEPCYWMFDRELSNSKNGVEHIKPSTQTEILIERSERLWERLARLDKIIEGCSRAQAKQIFNIFDNLAVHFKERLKSNISEPRAVIFTISGLNDDCYNQLIPLLNIARKAQYLYVRQGPAKDEGRRESYYVPNRMLMPSRGLDPCGQHARVSLKANDILNAANGIKIPFNIDDNAQGDLLDETL